MREIKFRAWYKKEKKMFDIVEINLQTRYVCFDGLVTTPDYHRICHFDYVELMQFTGLRDKNGKEIYEGDIVTCYLTYMNVNGVVEWDEQYCSWAMRVIPKKNDRFNLPKSYWIGEHTKLEILGNIYENPELLVM